MFWQQDEVEVVWVKFEMELIFLLSHYPRSFS